MSKKIKITLEIMETVETLNNEFQLENPTDKEIIDLTKIKFNNIIKNEKYSQNYHLKSVKIINDNPKVLIEENKESVDSVSE